MSRRVVNLDEARIASEEDKVRQVVFGGTTYDLPAELPISVVIAITDQDIGEAVRGLFGIQAKAVLEAGLSVDDLNRIAEQVYGLGQGESAASPG
jgi:hypothetical protein